MADLDAGARLRSWAKVCPHIDPSSQAQVALLGQLRSAAAPGARVSMKQFLEKLTGLKRTIHAGASVELCAFGVPKINFPTGLPDKYKHLELSAADLEEYELAGAEQGQVDTASFFVLDYYQVEKPSELGPKLRVLKFFSNSGLFGKVGDQTGAASSGGPATGGPAIECPATGGPATGGPATGGPSRGGPWGPRGAPWAPRALP